MTLQILDEFAEKLPPRSAYFLEACGRAQGGWRPRDLTLGERYETVLGDVAFGFRLASAYHKHGQNLPLFIQEKRYLPFRAFNYLLSPNPRDKALGKAHALWQGKQRPILEAFLLAGDAKLVRIAKWFQVTAEVVVLYARLFYNVRERLDNPAFIGQLLHWHRPNLGLGGEKEENENDVLKTAELRLKRVGHRKGVSGLLRALDIPSETPFRTSPQLLDLLRQESGRDALPGVTQGLYAPEENPALELFMELASQQKDGASNKATDALTNLSLNKAINIDERFMQHIKPGLTQRLAVSRNEVPTNIPPAEKPPDLDNLANKPTKAPGSG